MLVSTNSYLVLGLYTDSDEKMINKRYKELLKLLSIEEIGGYDTDLSFINYDEIRKEEHIKNAFHNLTNQTKKLHQTFFWFQIMDDIDETSFDDILNGRYIEGLDRWLAEFERTNKFHYLKNHVIGELLLYENKKQIDDVSFVDFPSSIVSDLYDIVYDDGFWKEFLKIFNHHNEIALREDLLANFRDDLPQIIAEYFFDLTAQIGNAKIYKEFVNVFDIAAKELDDNTNVTEPIKIIEDKIKSINNMKLIDDLDDIIDQINKISGEIKKLDALGLKDNPKIIKIKDSVAGTVRSLGISLSNDHNDPDNAKNFIEEAKNIAYSKNIVNKLENDRKDILGLLSEHKKYNEKLNVILSHPVLLKDLDVPITIVKELVQKGGKFVIYKKCISFIIMTQKSGTDIYFIPPGVSGFSAAIEPTLITLFFGWWGIPWGPIYSLECIFSNIFGGKNVTNEILDRL